MKNLQLFAEEVEFLSTKNNTENSSNGNATDSDATELQPIEDDSLPF